MLSTLGNRKIIASILTMAFLIVGAQGMSYAAPDLELSALTLSPTSVDAGDRFDISVTVTNAGDAEAADIMVIFFLDADNNNEISSGDEIVDVETVSSLTAVDDSSDADEDTVGISARAPSDGGRYYYGAYVIPVSGETDVTDNYEDSDRLVVANPAQPDLQVTDLRFLATSSYDPITRSYTVDPNTTFTLQATVTNGGEAQFNGSDLAFEYEISSTPTLPARPRWQPTSVRRIASPIAINRSSEVTITLSSLSGSSTIPYYYHVRVAPADGVSDSANNGRIPSIPIITASPDLRVDTPTVSGSTSVTLAPGELFTLTAIVRNAGRGPSSPATLTYYRSTDSTITTDDTEVGTADHLSAGILSGSTNTQDVALTAPTTPRVYYYGACVTTNVDADVTNNCSDPVIVTVSAPPDLVAELFELRTNTVAPRDRLTLDATVTNQGEGQSAVTTLRFYESTSRRFTSETEIDRVSVGALARNRSSNETGRLTVPSEPGTYYYRAKVDTVANEETTFNNTSNYIVIVVEAPLTIESVSPSKFTLNLGERFTLTATVRNDGTTTSARTAVQYYRSADNSITSRDTSMGTEFVSGITARQTSQVSRSLTAPNTAGTYYYGACIGDSTGSCMVVRITVVEETIVANLERPPIYWVNADGGSLQSLTRSEVAPFASGVRNANSIAVDMEGGKVYWTEDTGANRGRVRRANLNGTNIELVRELTNAPRGIAIDPSKGKLYVTNARGNIHKMNLDGTLFHWNFIVDLTSPGGIAVDAAGGKIYWTEDTGNERGRVRRANLNGTNIEPVRTLASAPRGIAIDPSKGKLYVLNARGNIHKMNLDGTLFHWNFVTGLDSPQGVAVDAASGKVYWTEASKIRRVNLDGSNLEAVATGIGTPAGIALSVAPISMEAPAAPAAAAIAPNATALHANYPNPFNPETWIPYQLQKPADVQISIHSQSGVLVRELSLGYQAAGQYVSRSRAAYWDGRNQLGEPVASGLYFYTLTAGDFSATRRMLILK